MKPEKVLHVHTAKEGRRKGEGFGRGETLVVKLMGRVRRINPERSRRRQSKKKKKRLKKSSH